MVGALSVAERLRNRIANLSIEGEGSRYGITISIGIAAFGPGEETIDATLTRAVIRLCTAPRPRVAIG